MSFPKSKSVLSYKDIFKSETLVPRTDLLKGMCKTTVIGELAQYNYRLNPKGSKYIDTSLKTQQAALFYFCGSNRNLFDLYRNKIGHYLVDPKNYVLIFTRQTFLYAIEELINSDLKEIPGFTMRDSWDQLLKYILSVNEAVTNLTNAVDGDYGFTGKNDGEILENINSKLIPLSELGIDTDPLYACYRGLKFFEFLMGHDLLSKHLQIYLESYYGTTHEEFIYQIFRLYASNNRDGVNDIENSMTGEIMDNSFYYPVTNELEPFVSSLSNHIRTQQPEKFISIRKFPFYRIGKLSFMLIDPILLLDKCYNQFINDFWFDCVKTIANEDGIQFMKMQDYRSIVGSFLEKYVSLIFKEIFSLKRHYIIKCLDQLKVSKNRSTTFELTDIYVRYADNIFLAEVKSSGLYEEQKYAGSTEKLYKGDRIEFFKRFGLNQLINAIEQLREVAYKFDPSIAYAKSLKVYPAIIVNEKALQTPFMAQIFNARFKEMLPANFEILNIFPLSIIHVSDLEQMDAVLSNNPNDFWRILKYNTRNPKFVPPFFNTINRLKIKPNYKRVRESFDALIDKFNKPNDI